MALDIVTGDLMEAKEQYIAHQCNCVSHYAAHLAKTMFTRFPHADIYSKRISPSEMGSIVIRGDGINNRYVINMLAQYYPGKPRNTDSAANRFTNFYKCLIEISKIPNMESIAFPWQIGCGSAAGNWDDYLKVLTRFANFVTNRTPSTKVVLYQLPQLPE